MTVVKKTFRNGQSAVTMDIYFPLDRLQNRMDDIALGLSLFCEEQGADLESALPMAQKNINDMFASDCIQYGQPLRHLAGMLFTVSRFDVIVEDGRFKARPFFKPCNIAI
ncbi:hypothetical protein ACQR3P_29160 [Rhodococcus sp. IEGM1300]